MHTQQQHQSSTEVNHTKWISFSVTIHHSARSGKLATSSGLNLETPACLLYTRKGLPPNLTPDLLSTISEAKALQIDFGDLYLHMEAIEKFGKGLAKFLALDHEHHILYCSLRDPLTFLESAFTGKEIAVNTSSGRQTLSVQKYMTLQKMMQVDFFSAPSYEVPFYSGQKRIKKCVDLTLEWLDLCLSTDPELSKVMFAVIQGGKSQHERLRSVQETLKRSPSGFVLGGFGLDEHPKDRHLLLESIFKILPSEKPRLIVGPGSPIDILELVTDGVDLFNTAYPNILTDLGLALTLPLESKLSAEIRNIMHTVKNDKINLRDIRYKFDTQPLVSHCCCYTCSHHTRAYIHHLLNTHEMLANILLTIHNCYHYLEFFRVLRTHLKNNTFLQFKNEILQLYNHTNNIEYNERYKV